MLAVLMAAMLVQDTLPVAAIEAAIARGQQRKRSEQVETRDSRALSTTSHYVVVIRGPLNHIATLSGRAARQYLPFALDQVADSLRRDDVARIWVEPTSIQDRSAEYMRETVQRVVLRHGDVIIQPTELRPVLQSNGRALVGTLPLSAIPRQDFDVLVITDMRELRIRVKLGDHPPIR